MQVKWFSKPLSDDEYVERVRSAIANAPRLRKWVFLFSLMMLVAAAALACAAAAVSQKVMEVGNQRLQAANPPAAVAAGLAWFGVGLGMIFGLKIGYILVGAIHLAAMAMSSRRDEKLMVRYYDALRNLAASDQTVAVRDDDGGASKLPPLES